MNFNEETAKTFLKYHGRFTGQRVARSREPFIGLELENEYNKALTDDAYGTVNNLGFRVEKDGSLRGHGYELISNPDVLPNLIQHTQELFKYLKAKNYRLSNSHRTSTHVHLNFSDYNVEEIMTFACLYWIFEPILFELAADDRKANIFCNPTSYTRQKIMEMLRNGVNPLYELNNPHTFKYSSLNFACYGHIGTLETRLFNGTDNPADIEMWLRVLVDLKESALKYKTLMDVKIAFEEKDSREFLMMTFPHSSHYLFDTLRKKRLDAREMMHRGYMNTLAFYSTTTLFQEARDFLANVDEAMARRLAQLKNLLQLNAPLAEEMFADLRFGGVFVPQELELDPAPVVAAPPRWAADLGAAQRVVRPRNLAELRGGPVDGIINDLVEPLEEEPPVLWDNIDEPPDHPFEEEEHLPDDEER